MSGKLGISLMLALGLLGLAMEYLGFFDLPGWAEQVLVLVNIGLGALGYRELVDAGVRSIREAIASWRSSNTFFGWLLVFVEQIFVMPYDLPVPVLVQDVLYYVGLALIALGIYQAKQRGRGE